MFGFKKRKRMIAKLHKRLHDAKRQNRQLTTNNDTLKKRLHTELVNRKTKSRSYNHYKKDAIEMLLAHKNINIKEIVQECGINEDTCKRLLKPYHFLLIHHKRVSKSGNITYMSVKSILDDLEKLAKALSTISRESYFDDDSKIILSNVQEKLSDDIKLLKHFDPNSKVAKSKSVSKSKSKAKSKKTRPKKKTKAKTTKRTVKAKKLTNKKAKNSKRQLLNPQVILLHLLGLSHINVKELAKNEYLSLPSARRMMKLLQLNGYVADSNSKSDTHNFTVYFPVSANAKNAKVMFKNLHKFGAYTFATPQQIKAVSQYASKTLSLREASKKFNIPSNTIQNKTARLMNFIRGCKIDTSLLTANHVLEIIYQYNLLVMTAIQEISAQNVFVSVASKRMNLKPHTIYGIKECKDKHMVQAIRKEYKELSGKTLDKNFFSLLNNKKKSSKVNHKNKRNKKSSKRTTKRSKKHSKKRTKRTKRNKHSKSKSKKNTRSNKK